MARLTWDNTSERYFETGISHGVLFVQNDNGTYQNGVPWNGLTKVSEKYSGGEAIHVYSDDYYYTDIFEREDLSLTLEAYTYPQEFELCTGFSLVSASDQAFMFGGQERKRFGLCYRTAVGNDVDGAEHGYRLHILYDCIAQPSEQEWQSINDSPELATFSWDIITYPAVTNGFRPVPIVIIDSRKTTARMMNIIESVLYGSETSESTMLSLDTIKSYMTNYLTTENYDRILFGGNRILV